MSRIYILIFSLFFFVTLNIKATETYGAFPEPTFISQSELTVYEAPSGAPTNLTFSVFVKYDGGEWIDLHEYNAPVDGNGETSFGNMSFVYFDSDFSKRIDVKIIKNDGVIGVAEIRPSSSGVSHVLTGDTIEFSITESKKVSVEIDGDLLNNLMIFANTLETNVPDPNDPNVHYFEAGIHKLGGDGKGVLSISSNETVYIAGGAIVYGHIEAKDPGYAFISNITIRGRGILSADLEEGHAYSHPDHATTPALIHLNIAQNVEISGIILHNSVTWNVHMNFCNNVVVNDIKIMSWAINSDGIDPQVSRDVLIDNCFVRNYDDCTSVKLNWYLGNNILDPKDLSNNTVNNITIQNSIYWTDQGRAILLGPEMASTTAGQIMEGITVRNMDILYVENYSSTGTEWAKGAIAINAGDGATVRDILFEDIRVDKLGNATNLFTFNLANGSTPFPFSGSIGQRIENITLNNITCNTIPSLQNYIHGYDIDQIISGMYFNNLTINGSLIMDATQGDFDINGFTEDIVFSTSLSIDDPSNILEVSVYPNPASNNVFIKNIPVNSIIKLFTLNGKSILQKTSTSDNVTININNVENGIYFLTVKHGERFSVKKLILSN